MDFKKLKEPFPAEDIDWRIQREGVSKAGKPWAMVLAYVTNRAIMDRLDEICGPQHWKNEYKQAPEGGILCGISIRIGDEWVTKWDGAENTNIEAVKGGLSGSMKRAAVQWGIGRYLYNLESTFATIKNEGINGKYKHYNKKQNIHYQWDPPLLPEWALPLSPKGRLNKLMDDYEMTDQEKNNLLEFYKKHYDVHYVNDRHYDIISEKFYTIFDEYTQKGDDDGNVDNQNV